MAFRMKSAPQEPVRELNQVYASITLSDGVYTPDNLQHAAERANAMAKTPRFEYVWKLVIYTDEEYDYFDVTVSLHLFADEPAQEFLARREKYTRDLAAYQQWQQDHAAEIQAHQERIAKRKTEAQAAKLEKQKKQLAKLEKEIAALRRKTGATT